MDTLYYILFLISWVIGVFFNYIDMILVLKSYKLYINSEYSEMNGMNNTVSKEFYKKIHKEESDNEFDLFGGFILGLIPFFNVVSGLSFYAIREVELHRYGSSYFSMLVDLQNVK